MAAGKPTTKRCPGCGETKDTATGFYENPAQPTGISSWCRSCTTRASLANYYANVEARRAANRERMRLKRLKAREALQAAPA